MPGKILMVTWDGAGNIPPEFALCQSLVEAGHSVHVLTHDSLRQRVFDIGATFIPLKEAGQYDSLTVLSAEESLQTLIEKVFLSKAFLFDLDKALDSTSPDVVIVDSFMLLELALAKQRNIPTIGFHHSLAEIAFGGPLDMFIAKVAFDSIVQEREMSAYETPVQALYEADVILTSTYKEFDLLSAKAPDHLVHIGPLRKKAVLARQLIERKFPNRPLVVISLSTSFMDQGELIQRLINSLADLEVEGLVTTGAAISQATLSLPENVAAIEFIPHEAVLPITDLLITHAGHGTVMAGVTFGTPMLCIPMGRDQPQVAARARDLGLAHVCELDASPDVIANKVNAAINDTEMAKNVRLFSNRMQAHPGIELAVKCIEEQMGF